MAAFVVLPTGGGTVGGGTVGGDTVGGDTVGLPAATCRARPADSGDVQDASPDRWAPSTRAAKAGRKVADYTTDPHGRTVVSAPVIRASTVIFPTTDSLRASFRRSPGPADAILDGTFYGRFGTLTHRSAEEAAVDVAHPGAYKAICMSSTSAALLGASMHFMRPGNVLLVPQSASLVCPAWNTFPQRMGVETHFYPRGLSGPQLVQLARSLQPKLVVLDGPTPPNLSLHHDIDQLGRRLKDAADARVLLFNRYDWYQPFTAQHPAIDVAITSTAWGATGGHDDLDLGVVACANQDLYRSVRLFVKSSGAVIGPASPDDAYRLHRSLRTAPIRAQAHRENARILVDWLRSRPEVAAVSHVAAASGQSTPYLAIAPLAVQLQLDEQQCTRFLDALSLVSLVNTPSCGLSSQVSLWRFEDAPSIRADNPLRDLLIHVGLEDVTDIIADWDNACDLATGA